MNTTPVIRRSRCFALLASASLFLFAASAISAFASEAAQTQAPQSIATSDAPPPAPQPSTPPQAEPQQVHLGYLGFRRPAPPVYDYESDPADSGIAGAKIAMRDMETTGRLTGQDFKLDEKMLNKGSDVVSAAKSMVANGVGLIIADLDADDLLKVSDAIKGQPAVLFNIQSEADRLRQGDCRANLYNIAPSRSMLTDALVQYLVVMKWKNVFLVVGKEPNDRLYADALRHSIKKFGLKTVGDKVWEFGNLERERADGPTKANALVFTRGTGADMILVADENGNFGDYLMYHTADPLLVGGTQGLTPATWSRVLDAWGSAQLQSRFVRTFKRPMRPLDYQAWVAVRAIGEAATRAKSGDPLTVANYIMRPDFEIAAFKGVPVSMRPWDRQLRQPILLVQPKMLVSVSPQPGFLNPTSLLDSLGVDKGETACKIPSGGKS